MQNEYVDHGSQLLQQWERDICDKYIIYGLDHKLTAVEVTKLISFAQKAGHIKLNQAITTDTLIHRARKYGLQFVDKPQQGIRFNREESKTINRAIASGVHEHKTANQVAYVLNTSGKLRHDVTPKYLQRKSYVLKYGALKMKRM